MSPLVCGRQHVLVIHFSSVPVSRLSLRRWLRSENPAAGSEHLGINSSTALRRRVSEYFLRHSSSCCPPTMCQEPARLGLQARPRDKTDLPPCCPRHLLALPGDHGNTRGANRSANRLEEILQKRRGAAGETGLAGVVKRRVPREPGRRGAPPQGLACACVRRVGICAYAHAYICVHTCVCGAEAGAPHHLS